MRAITKVVFIGMMCTVGCTPNSEVQLELADEPSRPYCTPLEEKANRHLRDVAVKYFLESVNVKVHRLRVANGVLCDGEVAFAIFILDDGITGPFYVNTDTSGANMSLDRPM